MVDAFSCVESDALLARFKSDERRRIKKHSKEMEDFLKCEAYDEQERGMNTTFLVLDDQSEKNIGLYFSLQRCD